MRYALIENGIVTNVIEWDGVPFNPGHPAIEPDTDGNGGSPAEYPSGWSPPDGTTAVLCDDSDNPHIGLGYNDGIFEQPAPIVVAPLTSDQIKTLNTSIRDSLLAQATAAIAPLQDAVDLDMATAADTAALKAWKTYRVLVNRIDLTLASPQWPQAPQS